MGQSQPVGRNNRRALRRMDSRTMTPCGNFNAAQCYCVLRPYLRDFEQDIRGGHDEYGSEKKCKTAQKRNTKDRLDQRLRVAEPERLRRIDQPIPAPVGSEPTYEANDIKYRCEPYRRIKH